MSGPQLHGVAAADKRKKTRARARMILRIAVSAMRGVQEMQSQVDKKQAEVKQMREAKAQGCPDSPSKHVYTAAVKELVALQRDQKRAARALLPKVSQTRRSKPQRKEQSTASNSPSHLAPENLGAKFDAAQDKSAPPLTVQPHAAAITKEVEELRVALREARTCQAETQQRLAETLSRGKAALEQCKADAAIEKTAHARLLKRNAVDIQKLQAEVESHKCAAEKARTAEAFVRSVNSRSTLLALKSADQQHKAATKAQIKQVVQKLEAEHASALQAASKSAEQQYRVAIEADRKQAADKIVAEKATAVQEALKSANQQHKAAIDTKQAEAQAALEYVEQQHKVVMEKLKAETAAAVQVALKSAEQRHKAAMEAKQVETKAALMSAEQQHKAAMEAKQVETKAALMSAEQQHKAAMEAKQVETQAALMSAEQQHKAEIDVMQAKMQEALLSAAQQHKAAMEAEISKVVNRMEAEKLAAVAAAESRQRAAILHQVQQAMLAKARGVAACQALVPPHQSQTLT